MTQNAHGDAGVIPPAGGDVSRETADRASLDAAITLALVIPADTLLYLLLPLYASEFGVSLPQVGILLAANRLVRIFIYRHVAVGYARLGARNAGLLAALCGVAAALSYAVGGGLWPLLAGRLVWGLSFATLNVANQALPTLVAAGSARRSGRSRSIIASGSMAGLILGAVIAHHAGPRWAFAAVFAASLAAPLFALRLPRLKEAVVRGNGPQLALPGAFSIWSFCFGFALDGIFVLGLSLVAKENFPHWAVLAAGVVLALRYATEMLLSPLSGPLAERFGAMRLMIALSLAIASLLLLLSANGPLLWGALILVVLLRALVQPLPPPVLAELYPGPERVPAMARQAVWRDIGAGTGPLAAGLLFPLAPAVAVWAAAAGLLAASSVWLKLEGGRRRERWPRR
jgi:MFS family permease